MGPCSRPGQDPNAKLTRAIEPIARLGSEGFWMRGYGGEVRVGRSLGTRWFRWFSPVRGLAR
jgi:hypothetical protein